MRRELWPNRPQWIVGSLTTTVMNSLRRPLSGDDRGSASVARRIEEISRCPFTNDFATLSALSAADHRRRTILPACRPLLPHVPPIPCHARLQRPRTLGGMATPRARRRAGWMVSRLPRTKSSSVLAATATGTGLENWRAVRSRCRAMSVNASAHPLEISSGPRASIAAPRPSP